jgi:hypothetical protein
MILTELFESLRTENPCWKGYHPVGTKKKNGRTVPNCVPNATEGVAEAPGAETLGHNQSTVASNLNSLDLGEGDKIGNMDADQFDDAMARLKKLAGQGPMKTVWDPVKRVYKNVPVAQQSGDKK